MAQRLDIEAFVQKQREEGLAVIDVRSPAEFAKGHFPSAHNIPLFDNEERAIVGTLYKQEGKEEAFLKGLDLVGPKMRNFVEEAKEIAGKKALMTYCWRGGMRSSSMAWLWSRAGMKVHTLEGGYKAFRREVLERFVSKYPLFVLGGPTGSGKTHILKELQQLGEQVVDLEDLANHKGSAFGAIGEDKQPSVEHFQNLLWQELNRLDGKRPIWVEDESIHIGKVLIPNEFFDQMQQAPTYVLRLPLDQRLNQLVETYTDCDDQLLIEAVQRIQKRLGGQNAKEAEEAIFNGEYRKAAEICLKYYDKTYEYGLTQKSKHLVKILSLQDSNPSKAAQKLLDLAYQRQPQ